MEKDLSIVFIALYIYNDASKYDNTFVRLPYFRVSNSDLF